MPVKVERQNRPRRLCILGCGDLGLRLAGRVPAAWEVTGIRRDITALPARVQGLSLDYTEPGSLAVLEALAPDYVVTTQKPAGRDEAGYRTGFGEAMRNLLRGLRGHRPRALLMISSTRVYRERDGAWVDEAGALSRDDPAAVAIAGAERALLDSGHNAAVLRCAGIYGDPKGRLLTRIAGGSICAPQPLHYSNRIHRDDVGGFLWHLVQQVERGEPLQPAYNVVDDCPAPQHEVEQWLASQLGVDARADRSPPGAGHKRCRNRALAASGYRLTYPDYRRGYGEVLRARG